MKSLLNLQELLKAVHGKLIFDSKDCYFTSVQTDSRNVIKNTLFVPLIGEFQNGHKYIPQAIEKGASVIFVKETEYDENKSFYQDLNSKNTKVVFILVEQTMKALQDAAEFYVSKFPELVKISITGSCGKTTTKEMLVSIFKAKYGKKVVYTKGNFNSETGLPLSVFQIRKCHKFGIFEMGMNRVNEIGEISKVLKSKYGVITNVGTAHIGILGSRENIAKEKRKSFDYIPCDGVAFVPFSDDFADYCVENVKGKTVKFGKEVPESESGVKFISDNGLFGTSFLVDGINVNLALSGEHNFTNALGVIACAKECGINAKYIKKGLEKISSLSGRMEIQEITLKNGAKVTVLMDCYNANPDSMQKIVEFCSDLKNVSKKIFVLADMKELGEKSKQAHEEVGKNLIDSNADLVFLVGPEMKYAFDYIKNVDSSFAEKTVYVNDKENFETIVSKINEYCSDNDVIALKGSHSMSLEKLLPMMKKSGGIN